MFNLLAHLHDINSITQVDRLEALHAKGYVHRDVKPENLVIGDEQNMDTIYLVDLGLSTSYRDPYSGEHISEFHEEDAYLMGTPLYYSVNRHYGIPHTRRDDLISLLYLMLYLKRGSLPWQGRTSQVMASMKVKAKIIQLCKGFPASFSVFAEYVTHLQFDSRPNYAHIRKLLRECMSTPIGNEQPDETSYDWELAPEDRGMRV